jgi:PPOX class probable FMN-dependent enzyme
MARIESVEQLRGLYKDPTARALAKVMDRLETHSRRFIELSPFLVIASVGEDGLADASPRGEGPGFVRILDDTTIAIPDRPGNNRVDTLSNIVGDPGVGVIFFIPGVDEVLRINGQAEVRDDAELLASFAIDGKRPVTAIMVTAEQVFLHCAKAIMRAGLWDEARKVERSVLPTMGRMLNDQVGSAEPAESQAEMVAR